MGREALRGKVEVRQRGREPGVDELLGSSIAKGEARVVTKVTSNGQIEPRFRAETERVHRAIATAARPDKRVHEDHESAGSEAVAHASAAGLSWGQVSKM
jgi:hypothetical protein